MKKIWDDEGNNHSVSKRLFIISITVWMVVGLCISAFMASLTYTWKPTWWETLGLFLVAIIAAVVTGAFNQTPLAIVGYFILTVAFGAILGPTVALYEVASVVKILFCAALVVGGCGTVGVLYPKSLESWGAYLTGGLLVLIVGQFGLALARSFGLAIDGALTFWDWAGLFLFSGFVMYDMNRAMRVERTFWNALFIAVEMYLNFVNIFIRLLSLFGESKD